jgi:hypothetical protein
MRRWGGWRCSVCDEALAPSEINVCRRFQKVLAAAGEDDDSAPMDVERAPEPEDDALPTATATATADAVEGTSSDAAAPTTLEGTGLWEHHDRVEQCYLAPGSLPAADVPCDGYDSEYLDEWQPQRKRAASRRAEVMSSDSEDEGAATASTGKRQHADSCGSDGKSAADDGESCGTAAAKQPRRGLEICDSDSD